MADNGKKESLEDYLKERIIASGFPLEIEISGLLDNEYDVYNSDYFFDKESENGRTIDIYANAKGFEERRNFSKILPYYNLVIECKKSNSHSWVFFTRPYINTFRPLDIAGQIDPVLPNVDSSIGVESTTLILCSKVYSILHYALFDKIAIAYDEIKGKKQNSQTSANSDIKKRNDILEAIMQIQKYICFKTHQNDGKWYIDNPTMLFFYYPIIVFDGDLFEAFSNSGKIELQRREHLIIKTDYLCPFSKNLKHFTLDIVHRSYFPEFLKLIKSNINESTKYLLKNENYFAAVADAQRRKAELKKNKKTD